MEPVAKALPAHLQTVEERAEGGKTVKTYEQKPQTPYQRLLESAVIPEVTKTRLHTEHARLDPFVLKNSIECKLKKFFTALGILNRQSTKP